jgi:hypothetical protein
MIDADKVRHTRTFALLDLSPAAYAEVRQKLLQASYDHVFTEVDGREVIDMNGIAVREEP